ncbi:glycoside hydrolase family 15 protein [Microbacterium oleivorans]|uniref:Glycoside hydrolase family 15 n=1 Tax=Microbacterium oleivorans TaxID=273677 RepID=A0A7D5EXQ4_9MICO|nr:glycoside hydrolase family 15 protein [Microbacterium oleivorans]QLD11870.1 glycoside hydrolase family 15 [Microbacterium oleivorans]
MTISSRVDLHALLDRSRTVITSLQEPNGAYPASPTFSAYRGYCWFRDGSFIADGASAAGEAESATAFFDWCAMVIGRHAERIRDIVAAASAGAPLPDDRMLPARFTFAGELGVDEWWDFQLDGYGTWLWAAADHAARHDLPVERWADAAALTVDYLLSSWERPCYDWWEEHSEHVHVSTLGCIAAGLEAAARSGLVTGERADAAHAGAERVRDRILASGVAEGHLTKWLGTDAVDGSLSSLIAPLGVVAPQSGLAAATRAALTTQLENGGGVYRFTADTFYGGGRWPLLSCFLGLSYAAAGDEAGARRLFAWAVGTATDDQLLPEQVDGELLAPERRQEWIERWGPVATPLLWSHAMVLRLAAELGLVGAAGGVVNAGAGARRAAVAS